MARKRSDNSPSNDGVQDSFLDITANIVGILILLVVVVGIRAAMQPVVEQQAHQQQPTEAPVTQADLDQQLRRVARWRQAVGDLRAASLRLEAEARQRERERDELATYVAALEAELEKEKRQLDEQDQQRLAMRNRLNEADVEYESLMQERLALVSTPDEVKEIVHTPTPIVRKQSDETLHLRLDKGRVAVVPFDPLVQLVVDRPADARRRDLERSNGLARMGPVDGFELLYAQLIRVSKPGPQGMRQISSMPAGEIRPVRDGLGEPLDEALRDDSQLSAALDATTPRESIVMLWAYGNSVQEIRDLQDSLRRRGYAVDLRLLPDGQHIAFSPAGRETAAQ